MHRCIIDFTKKKKNKIKKHTFQPKSYAFLRKFNNYYYDIGKDIIIGYNYIIATKTK